MKVVVQKRWLPYYRKIACLVAALLSIGSLVNFVAATEEVVATGCTYDGRSLIINGKREIIFSGSIHYPRSQPDVSIFF
jgi:Glycosyl hydrolases family 35